MNGSLKGPVNVQNRCQAAWMVVSRAAIPTIQEEIAPIQSATASEGGAW